MKYVVPEEQAVKEIAEFVEYHTDKPIDPETVSDQYPSVISSVMRGLLDLTDPQAPVLKLREPIKTESGAVDTSEIKFKTRIKPSTYNDLAKGLDLKKDSMRFSTIITAHLADLPSTALLDVISNNNKHDYKTIQQLVSLFM